ncbi:MAG TPA: glucosamine-6-phosphate deaminase, partial [Planctomycetaceae bacterium]|nr:glucosamine-6-phosphate deaminase [Planctomycetaceae bacterium]
VIVESLIQSNNAAGRKTVLGLPTGSTPMGVYRELIRMYQEDGLDFSRVITFNLDEYWPMQPDSIHSYNRFMWENFFRHVNVRKENVHIPDGTLRRRDVESFCEDYERAIEKAGGLDLQLLGIGRSGHIGFNEPGSARNSRTRLVTLDPITRLDAASGFFGEENVPHQAITMGVGSILSARKVIMMAMGEHKAAIIQRAVEEEVTEDVTASFLQTHPNAVFVLDDAASAELTAVRTPWLVGRVDWTPPMEKRALIWLAEQTGKPLLKLDARDFQEHQLYDLVRENGPVATIRQRVFETLLSGICPRPGGETSQTVIVFSPHPDDDVISMGGTLITLAEQGHDVHIAYMTSGNIAVFDHDALRHIEFLREFLDIFRQQTDETGRLYEKLRADMARKQPGDPDTPDVLEVKALIRQTEAIAAARIAGVPAEKLHFLNLPFYRTGTVAKRELSEEDVEIVAGLLRERKPAQIYVAGDLSDPHGTHRMCAQAILRALPKVAASDVRPEVWLYRGAWQEYEPHEIERAVPLSPEVTLRKKLAIFRHESQKDRALFPGHDEREFWVRAEERTKYTARIYNELGLPEYYALEGFVQYAGQQL